MLKLGLRLQPEIANHNNNQLTLFIEETKLAFLINQKWTNSQEGLSKLFAIL